MTVSLEEYHIFFANEYCPNCIKNKFPLYIYYIFGGSKNVTLK